jgi:hypothetical protein
MTRHWRKQLRRLLLRATALALGCNFIVPPGYMPAALADGGPFAFCPSTPGPGLPADHSNHHGHQSGQHSGQSDAPDGDSDPASPGAWDYCPLGVLSASCALTAEFSLALEFGKHVFNDAPEPASLVQPLLLAFHSRAPPPIRRNSSLS